MAALVPFVALVFVLAVKSADGFFETILNKYFCPAQIKSYLDRLTHPMIFRLRACLVEAPEVEAGAVTVCQRLEPACRRASEGCLCDLSGGPRRCRFQWCRGTTGGMSGLRKCRSHLTGRPRSLQHHFPQGSGSDEEGTYTTCSLPD